MAKAVVQGGNPLENIHTFDGLTTGDNIQSGVLVKEGTDTPLRSHTTRGLAVDPSGTAVSSGRSTITTAGSAAQLNGGSSVPCKAVMVVALPTNVGTGSAPLRVAVGASNVDAADVTLTGIPLEPLQGQVFDVSDVNLIYFDVLGDGHGVTWTVVA
jgi:hypothetical protein